MHLRGVGEQWAVPCAVMRGGTSRAVIFRADVLPEDPVQRDEILMSAIGSGDPRQIDGLGGADQLTSKVAIVGPSTRSDADVDYTFGQVGIGVRHVSYDGNCGNISSAAGVFAVEEGMVAMVEPYTLVRMLNTNTDKIMQVRVPVANGAVQVRGEFAIAGVPGTGAEVRLDFSRTAGTLNGKLLPTGSARDVLTVAELGRTLEVSIVDVAKPVVFFRFEEIGLSGDETPDDIADDLLQRFVAIQRAAARMLGIAEDSELPRPAAVAAPRAYRDFLTGTQIDAEEISFLGRWVGHTAPPVRLRKAYAGTGAVCTAVAAVLPGTVVHAVSRPCTDGVVRIGHPSGVFPVRVQVVDGEVREVSLSRTVRRIAQGEVLVPALG